MEYLSAAEISSIWNITKRRVQVLCAEGRILKAKRIGNMWVVPKDTAKPTDARVKSQKEGVSEIVLINPVKNARNEVKSMLTSIVKEFSHLNLSPDVFRMSIIGAMAATLVCDQIYTKEKSDFKVMDTEFLNILSYFNISDKRSSWNEELMRSTHKECSDFIKKHKYFLDDLLSWAYQYLNKLVNNNNFSETQFFTEKYMVSYLVDSLNIYETDGKILDPACGGANFLIYALDVLCDYKIKNHHNQVEKIKIVTSLVKNLYGYDLDKNIAKVAVVNIKMKALSILKKHKVKVSIELFETLKTSIYYSKEDNRIGSLDKNTDRHNVINIATKQNSTLSRLFSNVKYIITNPPFQTVKGMEEEVKAYLKNEYSLSKCDVCNSFVEQILENLPKNSKCGIVTQNSWLFLDSFKEFRQMILSNYIIDKIIDLGSSSFYDLNGEKSSVALVVFVNNVDKEHEITATSLKNKILAEKENILASSQLLKVYLQNFKQDSFMKNIYCRIDLLSSGKLKSSFDSLPPYSEFAVPMQGTSTGNAKKLLDYFWNHFNDKDWVLVSKGGGYCKWNGLNYYVLKWGKNGEFISNTKGSAMRNVKQFNNTKLVFSDTGTSGLNVRLLKGQQLFVASGPGIRLIRGDKYAHLALLNSRLFSYYIKITSPKLTIAAGYISKIPTVESVLLNHQVAALAKECSSLKESFNIKRPVNFEYINPQKSKDVFNLKQWAIYELLDDLRLELERLFKETIIDDIILKNYEFGKKEKQILLNEVGECAYRINRQPVLNNINIIDSNMAKLLNELCELKRTKSSKTSLGCDGILEFMADEYGYNPCKLYDFIVRNVADFELLLEKYTDFIMHRLVLDVFGYNTRYGPSLKTRNLQDIVRGIQDVFVLECSFDVHFVNWIKKSFNDFHAKTFYGQPFLDYNHNNSEVIYIGGEK